MALPFLQIFDLLGKVVDRVVPDPTERAKLQLELAKLADAENAREHAEMLGQIEVNKVEAASLSLFVAGWRPAVGWGCGAALVYNTMLAPMLGLGVADLGFLQTVLLAMLGIGGMRTAEKLKGVAQDAKVASMLPSAPVPAPAAKPKKKGLDLWPF